VNEERTTEELADNIPEWLTWYGYNVDRCKESSQFISFGECYCRHGFFSASLH